MELDRFQGCILGLAIGDALGFPVEFLNLSEIKEKFPEGRISKFYDFEGFPKGTYSDDTQMTIAVANALVNSKTDDSEEIMRNMSKEFIKWKNSPENNRAPGLSCLKGISNLELGKDWKYSGVNSEGCGAAMRTAPIGLVYHDNLGKLKEIALNSAIITHNNPVAIASAVANAYLVARAINNEPKENALEDLIRFTQGVSDKFTNKILQVEELLDLQPERAIPFLGEGWTGHEAIAIALCSCIKSDFDFEKSIITAANITGDSDSTASIAGGIAGAYCGLSGIPDKFYKELENSELLRKVAEELYLK